MGWDSEVPGAAGPDLDLVSCSIFNENLIKVAFV